MHYFKKLILDKLVWKNLMNV